MNQTKIYQVVFFHYVCHFNIFCGPHLRDQADLSHSQMCHDKWSMTINGCVYKLRAGQTGQHFAEDIFKRIYLPFHFNFTDVSSQSTVSKSNQQQVQWHWFRNWLGNEQVTSHHSYQWRIYKPPGFNELINSSPPSATYMCQWIQSALVKIMACRVLGTKPLSKPMLG